VTPAQDALTAAVADLREVVRDLRSELALLRQPSPAAVVAPKPYLTAAETALELGIGERSLRRLRAARGFPRPIRGPGPLRWRWRDIQAYLEGGR
jgi:predicted DNA-binding transcriptional regulator AlpA